MTGLCTPLDTAEALLNLFKTVINLFKALINLLKAIIHPLLRCFDTSLQLTQLWRKKILNNCADIFNSAHRALRILSLRLSLKELLAMGGY